ncbi:tripartite motif-containing protein 35-like [Salvelinus namaycush]|uniref:Tripartite motif-containing protein 35-like n=1 Tax=Salvelinus namaycush TaxID=8040 RepID=A0A8U1F542_SALNM|nr:tripartite motif-containing protein 35-like [Salvelinus namaycush]
MAESYLDSYLCCHICSETFREPVSLGCHHSFCSSCLDKFWDQTKNKNCPVCKRKSSKDHPNVNFQLKELSDKYTGREKAGEKDCVPDEDREVVCTKHTDEPKWFCEVEQRAVCHVCEFPSHHGHTVIPLEQAVKDLKEKLTSELDSLQSKQVKCKDIKKTYNKMCQYSKKQLVSTERQIRGEFEKLHQFLREEEEARLAALREEEEEKGKMIAREMKNIQDQISSLTESITAVKQELKKQGVPFLKKYKHTQTFSRAQYTLPDPQLVSGALIDVAKHLGNLQFRVWEKMQGIVKYTPVILDPNTANDWLSLSDDLTSVSQTDLTHQLPDNPERNIIYITVLGSEGFSSGKHSWEVEVGDHPHWYMGVAKETIKRQEKLQYFNPDFGAWLLMLTSGKYQINGGSLTLKKRPQRIRVQLDYDRGEVSFYDPKDMTHIYTFRDTFTERLYPYFFIGNGGDAGNTDIQICQSEVSLTVKSFQ